MRNEQTSKRRIPWRLVWLCGGTLALFGAAAPASAGDTNFERGFERELGRILAHEAVNAGKAILFQGVVHPNAHLEYADHRRGNRYYGNPHNDRRHWRKQRRIQHRRWQRRQHRHDHAYQRRVRHGYYYDDDYGHRKHRKNKHKKHRRQHRHDDDCDGHY